MDNEIREWRRLVPMLQLIKNLIKTGKDNDE